MSRSTARIAVMQLIYERISGGQGGEESLQLVYEQLREEAAAEEKDPSKSEKQYIQHILDGVLQNLEEIDSRIEAVSQGWRLDRMPRVDLTILRMAVWELLYEPDVPGSVVINEAVNLAKKYSEPQSGRFINGVLGTILREQQESAQ